MLEELISEFANHGYCVSEIIPDGKIHRFPLSDEKKKESGWYVIFRGETKNGSLFFAGSFGDWKSGQKITCCTLKSRSKEDKKFIDAQFKKAEKAFDAAQEIKWKETQKTCTDFWAKLPAIKNPVEFDYLIKKGLPHGYGARYSSEAIYLSVSDVAENVWGVQKIMPDGTKLFQPGTKKKGNFFRIGDVPRETAYICEGFATGASIHEATGSTVFCAFDAGNLPSVTAVLRKAYPEVAFAICADNDQFTEKNPGREFAEKCGLPVIFPAFSDLTGNPTDFNDLHQREGIDKVREQILQVKTEKQYVKCLGFRGDSYFYTSSDNLQITEIGAHSSMALLKLMPLEYWATYYLNEKTQTVNWNQAISELKERCREKGIFTKKDIRGNGVWFDRGKIICNLGNQLFYNGKARHLHSIESKYFYELDHTLAEIHSKPLTVKEIEPFVELLGEINYAHKQQGLFLGGWMALAPICGILSWRPHLWLTGEPGAGKTTVKEMVDTHIENAFKRLSVNGATTEAGLRQSLRSAAIPLVFDELEPESRKSRERVDYVIELCRQASSENKGEIVKGGAGGEPTGYGVRFMALVSSVKSRLIAEADKSRFTYIELDKAKHSNEQWIRLNKKLEIMTPEFSTRIFSRTIQMAPIILHNIKIFQSAFVECGASQRVGQQYGTLCAGWYSLTSDSKITAESAVEFVKLIDLKAEDSISSYKDQEECLHFLLNTFIPWENMRLLVLDMIRDYENKKKDLERYGIRMCGPDLFVSAINPQVDRLFEESKWGRSWKQVLRRLHGVKREHTARINKIPTLGILIPGYYFQDPDELTVAL